MRTLVAVKVRDVTADRLSEWVGVGERRWESTLRLLHSRTGVTHSIRLIYIPNAAQGDEHDYPLKANRAEGRTRQWKKSLKQEVFPSRVEH